MIFLNSSSNSSFHLNARKALTTRIGTILFPLFTVIRLKNNVNAYRFLALIESFRHCLKVLDNVKNIVCKIHIESRLKVLAKLVYAFVRLFRIVHTSDCLFKIFHTCDQSFKILHKRISQKKLETASFWQNKTNPYAVGVGELG